MIKSVSFQQNKSQFETFAFSLQTTKIFFSTVQPKAQFSPYKIDHLWDMKNWIKSSSSGEKDKKYV